jgi:hypothetical protein
LRKLLSKDELSSNLKIKTTISQKQSNDFFQISDTYKKGVLNRLKLNYPKHRFFLDSLYKQNRLSNISIIVMNNSNGEIENCSFNTGSPRTLFDPNQEFKATDLYGYILTFDKGKNLNDTFASEINRKAPQNYQIPSSVTVSGSFTRTLGGNIMSRPYDYYSISDWSALAKKLDINLDFSEYRPGRFSLIKTSLFDLVKTISIIQNNGESKVPIFIRSVQNERNQVIYSVKNPISKRILSEQVVQNMQGLFINYMTEGPGIKHYRSNGIIEDCFLFTGGNSDYNRWLIYTNHSYTFGLVETNVFRTGKNDYSIRRRERFMLSSIMKELLQKMHLNTVKGQNARSLKNDDVEIEL